MELTADCIDAAVQWLEQITQQFAQRPRSVRIALVAGAVGVGLILIKLMLPLLAPILFQVVMILIAVAAGLFIGLLLALLR